MSQVHRQVILLMPFLIYCLSKVEASYSLPEDSTKDCFSFGVFEKFALYFGLVELQYTANERDYFFEIEVKATPLLKSFVQFKKGQLLSKVIF